VLPTKYYIVLFSVYIVLQHDIFNRFCVYILNLYIYQECVVMRYYCRRVARILFRWVGDGPFEKSSFELSVYNITKRKYMSEVNFRWVWAPHSFLNV